MKIEIIRTSDNEVQTEGVLHIIKDDKIIFECFTIELPWKNNQKRISCIPPGVYVAQYHTSPKLGKSLWLRNVPNRSEILIHKGNYYSQIAGCILVGESLTDINKDGQMDVTNSIKTLNKIFEILKENINDYIRIEISYRNDGNDENKQENIT